MMAKLFTGAAPKRLITKRLRKLRQWKNKNVVDEFEGQEVYVFGSGNFKIENGKRIWLTAPPASYYQENIN